MDKILKIIVFRHLSVPIPKREWISFVFRVTTTSKGKKKNLTKLSLKREISLTLEVSKQKLKDPIRDVIRGSWLKIFKFLRF